MVNFKLDLQLIETILVSKTSNESKLLHSHFKVFDCQSFICNGLRVILPVVLNSLEGCFLFEVSKPDTSVLAFSSFES